MIDSNPYPQHAKLGILIKKLMGEKEKKLASQTSDDLRYS